MSTTARTVVGVDGPPASVAALRWHVIAYAACPVLVVRHRHDTAREEPGDALTAVGAGRARRVEHAQRA